MNAPSVGTLFTYRASFRGCKLGALGYLQPYELHFEAESLSVAMEIATQLVYAEYEHISGGILVDKLGH